jgi:hypothetical protein
MCYTTNGTTPATNGSGTGCTTGTQYTTPVVVSSPATLKVIAGTSTLSDSTVSSYTYTAGQASPATCSPTSGNVPQTVTCTNPNSGTTVACYTTNSSTPATNGLGTGCTTGTAYATSLTISVAETLKIIAGTSTLTDSTVSQYTYTSGSNIISPPVNLIISKQAPRIELEWGASKTEGVDYNIRRSVSGGNFRVVKSGLQQLSWTDTDVERGTAYAYKSKAYLPPPCSKDCDSVFSDAVSEVCCQ